MIRRVTSGALGARADAGFRTCAPAAVLDAVTFGRPPRRRVTASTLLR
ncbi:MAG: hypothetical protein ABWY11_19660 [Umezawaea sp.]